MRLPCRHRDHRDHDRRNRRQDEVRQSHSRCHLRRDHRHPDEPERRGGQRHPDDHRAHPDGPGLRPAGEPGVDFDGGGCLGIPLRV